MVPTDELMVNPMDELMANPMDELMAVLLKTAPWVQRAAGWLRWPAKPQKTFAEESVCDEVPLPPLLCSVPQARTHTEHGTTPARCPARSLGAASCLSWPPAQSRYSAGSWAAPSPGTVPGWHGHLSVPERISG